MKRLLFPLITLLFFSACNPSPTPAPTAAPLAGSVEEFLVWNTAPEIASTNTFFIVFSVVKYQKYLNGGVSTDVSDIQECWLYSNGELSACDPSILSQDEYKTVERVFFAVGSPGEDQVLYLVDVYPHLIPKSIIETSGIPPEIKGYRILLVKEDGQWQESWRVRIRVWTSPWDHLPNPSCT